MLEIRWPLLPVIAAATKLVAALEQRDHVLLIERLFLFRSEGLRDRGQIEISAVLTALQVHAVEVAATLILDQGSDRPAGDLHEPGLHRFPFWIEPRVPDDEQPSCGRAP